MMLWFQFDAGVKGVPCVLQLPDWQFLMHTKHM